MMRIDVRNEVRPRGFSTSRGSVSGASGVSGVSSVSAMGDDFSKGAGHRPGGWERSDVIVTNGGADSKGFAPGKWRGCGAGRGWAGCARFAVGAACVFLPSPLAGEGPGVRGRDSNQQG